jgi:Periplasmic copper-binding protein (NosD)
MRKITLSIGVLGLAFAPLLFAAPANAQATRTWVSGVGDDANPCSRTAPCKTYSGTISKTATNGEINCLDPGGFGSLTITKSISVVCDYTEGGVLAAGTFGFNINATAGSLVTLKGQDVECVGTGTNGIQVLGVGVTVHVHKTQIRSCRNSGGSNGNGILVAPSSGTAKVFVADSYITDNGGTLSNAGILIKPTAGASANVSVNRVQLENNFNGIFMDASGGGGASNVNVNDSLLGGSSNAGIVLSSSGTTLTGIVTNSLINFNATGATSGGIGSTLRLGGNTIANNGTGVSAAGGTLQSFKNNAVAGNSSDGTPMTAFPGPGGTPLQ